jgi:hypothetical protein
MSPVADYEVFNYKLADEPVLPLDQAEQKAAELRSHDPLHVYRVVPADPNQSGFVIVQTPINRAYAELWARMYGRLLQWAPPPVGSWTPPSRGWAHRNR